jgi:hypothetical protein
MAMTASDAATTLRSLLPRLDRAAQRDKGHAAAAISAARELVGKRTADVCAQLPPTAALTSSNPAQLADAIDEMAQETWNHPHVGDAIDSFIDEASGALRAIERTIEQHSGGEE